MPKDGTQEVRNAVSFIWFDSWEFDVCLSLYTSGYYVHYGYVGLIFE